MKKKTCAPKAEKRAKQGLCFRKGHERRGHLCSLCQWIGQGMNTFVKYLLRETEFILT